MQYIIADQHGVVMCALGLEWMHSDYINSLCKRYLHGDATLPCVVRSALGACAACDKFIDINLKCFKALNVPTYYGIVGIRHTNTKLKRART